MQTVLDHTYAGPGTYRGKLRLVDEAGNTEPWKPFVVTVSDLPGNPEIPRQLVEYPGLSFSLMLPGVQDNERDEIYFPRDYFTSTNWDISLTLDPLPFPTSGGYSAVHARIKHDHYTQSDIGDILMIFSRYPGSPTKEYKISVSIHGDQEYYGESDLPITNVSLSMRDRFFQVSAPVDWITPSSYRLLDGAGTLNYADLESLYGTVNVRLDATFAGHTAMI